MKILALLDGEGFLGGNEEEESWHVKKVHYDPVYESIPKQVGQFWIFSLPQSKFGGGGGWRGIEIMQILRGVDNLILNNEESRQIQTLSETVSKMRRVMQENPLQNDLSIYMIYLAAIKKLESLFRNNTTPFQTFFPLDQQRLLPEESSSLFLYEYINALLYTLQYVYQMVRTEGAGLISGGTQTTIKYLSLCQSLLQETIRWMDIASASSSESGGGGDKWKYRVSPVSIGSGENYERKFQSIQDGERESLRIYISEFLCGSSQAASRVDLLDIRKNEIRVGMMRERDRVEGTPPLMRRENLYHEIVPLIRNVCIGYDSLTKKYSTSGAYIVDYSEFMSYYWFLYGEFLLAEIDWQCSLLTDCSEFDVHGKSSLKRLELVQRKRRERENVRQVFPLGYELEKMMNSLLTEMDSLEYKVREAVEIPMAYNHDSVQLQRLEPFQPISSSRVTPFQTLLDSQWTTYTTKTNPSMREAFLLLEKLKYRVITVDEIRVPEERVLPEEEEMAEIRIRNKEKSLVIEERVDWLEWLLKFTDERGEIRLSKKEVNVLEKEYREILQISRSNKSLY